MQPSSRTLRGVVCIISAFVVLAASSDVRAQTTTMETSESSTSGALFDELARMDSLLFDASFVSCEPEVANAIFANDVEFYHDHAGFQDSEETREATRQLTASCPGDRGVTRTIVDGSLNVYPIHDYGAVQTGTHVFQEQDAATRTVAMFVHLWRKQDGEWELTRVLSFDHRSEPVRAAVQKGE